MLSNQGSLPWGAGDLSSEPRRESPEQQGQYKLQPWDLDWHRLVAFVTSNSLLIKVLLSMKVLCYTQTLPWDRIPSTSEKDVWGWFPCTHMGFCKICHCRNATHIRVWQQREGFCLLLVCSEDQRSHLSDYCTIKMSSWGSREKVHHELQACLPLTLPLSSDSSFYFSLD